MTKREVVLWVGGWILVAIAALFVAVPANAEDWRQHKAWQAEYQDAKQAAADAAAFERLATLPHCTRAGNEWVGAWAVQTAAWRYHEAGDRTNAERCARLVIDNPSALKETKAKAQTIVAHWLSVDGKFEESLIAYDDALEIDPNLESARKGSALVKEALRSKNAGS